VAVQFQALFLTNRRAALLPTQHFILALVMMVYLYIYQRLVQVGQTIF